MEPTEPFGRDELAAALSSPIREAAAGADTGAHTVTPLGGAANAGATGGLWRVAGVAGAAGAADASGAVSAAAAADAPRRWSVVLKLVRHSDGGSQHWRSSDDAADPMYWKREALLYRSGLLRDLAGGLRAPDCLHVAERPDGSVALWLEDVGGVAASDWPLQRYAVAARHLGAAQAGFAVRADALPRWLSRGWLRAYVERRAAEITAPLPPGAWSDPLVRVAMPQPLDGWVADVWGRRAELFALLAELPRTLCHLDVWPPNLFADADGRTVAIDWAYAGVGALGEDVGNLVPDAVLDWFVDGAHARDLHERTVAGYLEGLSAAGWDGDPAEIRFAVAASAVLKYLWMAPALVRRALDHDGPAAFERQFARPVEELYRQRRHVLDLLRTLDGEAARYARRRRH